METTRQTPMPVTEVNPESALYIMRLPDRALGYWDNAHIQAVTGYDWDHWRSVFAEVKGLEAVIRNTTTSEWLHQSNRYYAMSLRAANSPNYRREDAV